MSGMMDRNERWDWWNSDERRKDLRLLLQEHEALGRYPTYDEMLKKYGSALVYELVQKYGSFEGACREASSYAYREQQRIGLTHWSGPGNVVRLEPVRGPNSGMRSRGSGRRRSSKKNDTETQDKK